MKKRIAVVLFNLGGPDNLDAVQPFLFNLFFDPAIIRLPLPLRWILARIISKRRTPVAQDIYEQIGGRSPILELTQNQADALQVELADLGEVKCFIAMRYWHPMSLQAAEQVKEFAPDDILLLPLYPQFSTTTTQSSLFEWKRAAKFVGLTANTRALCCYPTETGWIDAQVQLISEKMKSVENPERLRLLFSAHGLPKKIVDGGDPYSYQIEQTAKAIVEKPGLEKIDWAVCYQSKVGRLEWTGPSLDAEIERAADDGVGLMIVPIAFVSEHSETLVELDMEYYEMAKKLGISEYHRVAAVGTTPSFITGLAELARGLLKKQFDLCSDSPDGLRQCPSEHGNCPLTSRPGT